MKFRCIFCVSHHRFPPRFPRPLDPHLPRTPIFPLCRPSLSIAIPAFLFLRLPSISLPFFRSAFVSILRLFSFSAFRLSFSFFALAWALWLEAGMRDGAVATDAGLGDADLDEPRRAGIVG